MRFPVVATFIYFEITLPSPECTVTNNNCFHSYLTQPSFYNITIFLTVNIFYSSLFRESWYMTVFHDRFKDFRGEIRELLDAKPVSSLKSNLPFP